MVLTMVCTMLDADCTLVPLIIAAQVEPDAAHLLLPLQDSRHVFEIQEAPVGPSTVLLPRGNACNMRPELVHSASCM